MADKVSKNFDRSEFKCKCGCGFDTVDVRLIDVLQDVRDHFDKPITITSGCRCVKHNRSVGGSKQSQHLLGRAADFKVKDIEPLDVYKYIDNKYPNALGLGLYKSWIHIDSRRLLARW